jgi:hypothetical protein
MIVIGEVMVKRRSMAEGKARSAIHKMGCAFLFCIIVQSWLGFKRTSFLRFFFLSGFDNVIFCSSLRSSKWVAL